MEPVPVSELVRKFIERLSSSFGNVLGRWEEIVGEQVAKYSVPVSLKNGVLKIHVLDNVWKHHLELNAPDLIEKINSRLTVNIVRQLVIKVGPLGRSNEAVEKEPAPCIGGKKRKRKKGPERVKTFPLTPESKKFIKELRDPELKQLARRLLKLFPPEEEVK